MLALCGAALPLIAGYGFGRRLTRGVALPESIRFAAGSALLSVCVFVLLLLHAARWWAFIGLALCAVALLWKDRVTLKLARPPWWAAIVAVAYGLLYLIYARTPEIQPDAISYHLSIAVEATRSGGFPARITFYDVLPLGIETLFAMAYGIGGDVAAKGVHLTFVVFTVPLLIALAESLNVPGWAGWCAGLLYAVTPVVGISGTSAYNDAAMTFFVLATCYLLLRRDETLLIPLGLCAGFCYAIKFTGGLLMPVVIGVLLYHRVRPWKTLAAMIVVACPWMLRAAFLTGNPFAPLMNRFFPNPYFHISAEQALGRYLRGYGGVSWASLPFEVTLRGDTVQGLLGPAWLLVPLALLALRKREGRTLLAAALIAGAPWLLNIGTRFLMPALPFLALVLCLVLPRAAAVALLLAHSVLSWPQIIPLWAPMGAWALDREIPLRVDPEYEKKSYERVLANLVNSNTKPGARVFDMANAPPAFTNRELINGWQSALGSRLVLSMDAAMPHNYDSRFEWKSSFPVKTFSAIRVRYAVGDAEPAVIEEIALIGPDQQRLKPNVLWSLSAWPNVWEAALAIDNNRVSGWSTWEPVRAGMFIEMELSQAMPITEVRVTANTGIPIELYGKGVDWQRLKVDPVFIWPRLNLRREAHRLLRREGVTHVLAVEGPDGLGRISKDMIDAPGDWQLQRVSGIGDVALFIVK